jgi:hypothetical protein
LTAKLGRSEAVTEVYSNALQTIIDEFKNISPEIKNTFISKKNGEIIANNQTTTPDQNQKLIDAFNNIDNKAETIGGIETFTIQGADNQLNIITMNDRYLATVSSRAADEKVVKTLTRVLVPTILSLVDQIITDFSNRELLETSKPQIEQVEEVAPLIVQTNSESPQGEHVGEAISRIDQIVHNEPPQCEQVEEVVSPIEQTRQNESSTDQSTSFGSGLISTEPSVSQLMIEKIGGFLVSDDTVRIDSEVIAKWNELYGGKQITRVKIETLEGKKGICKFKPIKNKNRNAKGIIQMPEKILQALKISEGKLLMVKPVIAESK